MTERSKLDLTDVDSEEAIFTAMRCLRLVMNRIPARSSPEETALWERMDRIYGELRDKVMPKVGYFG